MTVPLPLEAGVGEKEGVQVFPGVLVGVWVKEVVEILEGDTVMLFGVGGWKGVVQAVGKVNRSNAIPERIRPSMNPLVLFIA